MITYTLKPGRLEEEIIPPEQALDEVRRYHGKTPQPQESYKPIEVTPQEEVKKGMPVREIRNLFKELERSYRKLAKIPKPNLPRELVSKR